MKTPLKGLALALALAPVALAASCTKNDASVVLYAVCRPPDDAEKCASSGKCDSVLANRPWVATRRDGRRVLNTLDMFVQVNNQMPDNGNPELGRMNTNDFVIEEFRLKFASAPALPLPATAIQLNQIVPADGSTTPVVTLIPEAVMKVIDDANFAPMYVGSLSPSLRVDVEMQVVGHTRDGRGITTEPWTVPVDVYDVDKTNAIFDPVCAKSTEIVTATCPNFGQTGTFKCAAP